MSSSADEPRVLLGTDGRVATLTLNRPAIHNAFDERLLEALTVAARDLAADSSVKVVVLAGAGKSFCAGADLDWMKRMSRFTEEENLADAMGLAGCLRALADLPQPLVGRVHGPVIGGGMGLVAVCDIVIAVPEAVFGFSEVRLGLSPACIAPYVIRRLGDSACRELFLTGDRFDGTAAHRLGLVHRLAAADTLDGELDALVRRLLANGQRAMASCKELLDRVPGMTLDEAGPYTASVIASLRAGEEGREGVRSFLERRKPSWSEHNPDEDGD
jgi:methylglutaconyl-CoA hydratase